MTVTKIKEGFWALVKELSFDTITSVEEAKPLFWGIIFPVIVSMIEGDLLPMIIVPGMAVIIMASKKQYEKAAETLKLSLLLPATALGIFFLGAILAAIA